MIGPEKGRIASYDSLTGNAKVEELEDIIPENYYLSAVAKEFPNINLNFSEDDKAKTPSVVDRCKERIRATGATLDKLLPIQNIVADIHGRSSSVPDALFTTAARMFENLNKLF